MPAKKLAGSSPEAISVALAVSARLVEEQGSEFLELFAFMEDAVDEFAAEQAASRRAAAVSNRYRELGLGAFSRGAAKGFAAGNPTIAIARGQRDTSVRRIGTQS